MLAVLAVTAYALSLLGGSARFDRVAMPAFVVGVAAHAAMLLSEIGSLGFHDGAARLGFGPVLSLTVCLALGIHAHGNWGFTRRGTYRMRFTLRGTSARGRALSATGTLVFRVG